MRIKKMFKYTGAMYILLKPFNRAKHRHLLSYCVSVTKSTELDRLEDCYKVTFTAGSANEGASLGALARETGVVCGLRV